MLRTILLSLALTACSVQAVPPKAVAQSPRYVVLDDYVRERLAADWDAAQRSDTVQVERAYCVKWQLDIWAGERAYRVTQIDAATVQDATPSTIRFTCPPGPNTAQLHVHPNHTCVTSGGPCWRSGPYAWQCIASDQDVRYLEGIGEPFGLVQCDTRAVVAFFPRRR
jgi:hypothetical protein